MGFGTEGVQAEDGTDFGSGMEEELSDENLESGDFDPMAGDGEDSVLEEMGMMPEDGLGGEELDGMEEQSTETVFRMEGSTSGELGDYPVEEELEAGETEEAGMNLDGTVMGDIGTEDVGIGRSMDALEKDGVSESSHISGTEASVEASGILSEIGSEAGVESMEPYGSEIEAGGALVSSGDKILSGYDRGTLLNDDFAGKGQDDTKVILGAGAQEVNGLGYHGFDTPVPPQVQGNPAVRPGAAASESRKQEYRKITEERKLREVPKSRKDLKKKKQNLKAEKEDSPK